MSTLPAPERTPPAGLSKDERSKWIAEQRKSNQIVGKKYVPGLISETFEAFFLFWDFILLKITPFFDYLFGYYVDVEPESEEK